MLDGQIWITLDRYRIEVENMPETRNNIAIKECLIHLCDNKPDSHEALKTSVADKSLYEKDENMYFSEPCNTCKNRFVPNDFEMICGECMHYAR